MPTATIASLSDEVHRAIERRAAQHGRSTVAEIRVLLEAAVMPNERIRLGSLLAELGKEPGGVDLTVERETSVTDHTWIHPE